MIHLYIYSGSFRWGTAIALQYFVRWEFWDSHPKVAIIVSGRFDPTPGAAGLMAHARFSGPRCQPQAFERNRLLLSRTRHFAQRVNG